MKVLFDTSVLTFNPNDFTRVGEDIMRLVQVPV